MAYNLDSEGPTLQAMPLYHVLPWMGIFLGFCIGMIV